jgi:hypothetical protein
MKKFVWAVFAITLYSCFGCNTEGKNPQLVIHNEMELSVEPGEHWQGKMKIFLFSVNKTPQMAAWLENDQGNYVSTITVTNRSAKKNWRSAPKEGRPEALPVWNHKIKNDSAQIDGVSAATSKGAIDVQIYNDSLINGQEYNVYLEINHSFDYNGTWPEKENDVNGQPSLIYHAKFIAGTSGRIKLIPIGHGSFDGSNGNIVTELDGMTTALTIIKDAYITIN